MADEWVLSVSLFGARLSVLFEKSRILLALRGGCVLHTNLHTFVIFAAFVMVYRE
jgi:hypothetical protein